MLNKNTRVSSSINDTNTFNSKDDKNNDEDDNFNQNTQGKLYIYFKYF